MVFESGPAGDNVKNDILVFYCAGFYKYEPITKVKLLMGIELHEVISPGGWR